MKYNIKYIGGFLTALVEMLQRKMFPIGAQDVKRVYFRRLGFKEIGWLLFLKPLTILCIIESNIVNCLKNGYHFFCILNK